MTLAEFARYRIDVYLRSGYITEKQAKKFHRELDIGGIVALILPCLILGGIILLAFGV